MNGVSTSVASWSALAICAAASTAAAQGAPKAVTQEPARLEDTGCVGTDPERTNELFSRAISAWQQGDTAGAVGAMRSAHAISKCSAFLFVLGEMLRQSESDCDALVWYERYVGDGPNVEQRERALDSIAELRARCPASPASTEEKQSRAGMVEAAPAAAAPGSAAPSPEPARLASVSPGSTERTRVRFGDASHRTEARGYWSPAHIGGWASLGASALLGSGAIYFAMRARSASSDYEQLWQSAVGDPAQRDEWRRQRAELEERGSSSATSARVLGGAAGALAVGGVLLLIFDRSGRNQDVALSAGRSAMMARYGVRF